MTKEHLLCICRALNARIEYMEFEIANEWLFDAEDEQLMTEEDRNHHAHQRDQIDLYKRSELPLTQSALAEVEKLIEDAQ